MNRIRNINTLIAEIDPDANMGEAFELVISHECWTGERWLPIVNKVGFYTRAEAEREAARVREELAA